MATAIVYACQRNGKKNSLFNQENNNKFMQNNSTILLLLWNKRTYTCVNLYINNSLSREYDFKNGRRPWQVWFSTRSNNILN